MLTNLHSILSCFFIHDLLSDPVDRADKGFILPDSTYGEVIQNNGHYREYNAYFKAYLSIIESIIGEKEKHPEQAQHEQYGQDQQADLPDSVFETKDGYAMQSNNNSNKNRNGIPILLQCSILQNALIIKKVDNSVLDNFSEWEQKKKPE